MEDPTLLPPNHPRHQDAPPPVEDRVVAPKAEPEPEVESEDQESPPDPGEDTPPEILKDQEGNVVEGDQEVPSATPAETSPQE